jgi:hypothetical protein
MITSKIIYAWRCYERSECLILDDFEFVHLWILVADFRVAAHIAHQQIQNSQRRNEARMLMIEAVKKAVKVYEGHYTEDAPPISIGF